MPWHIDGRPNDEVFTSEGAAIARAWELTPPGGKRPEVRETKVWPKTHYAEDGKVSVFFDGKWREVGEIGAHSHWDRGVSIAPHATMSPDGSVETHKPLGGTGKTPPYVHMTPPKDRVEMRLLDCEMVLEREREFLRAKGVANMGAVIDAFDVSGDSAGEVIDWAKKTIRELVERRIEGPAEVIDIKLHIESTPSLAPIGLDPARSEAMVVEAELVRVSLPPF